MGNQEAEWEGERVVLPFQPRTMCASEVLASLNPNGLPVRQPVEFEEFRDRQMTLGEKEELVLQSLRAMCPNIDDILSDEAEIRAGVRSILCGDTSS